PALAMCAAIRAPIVPAPRTATLLMRFMSYSGELTIVDGGGQNCKRGSGMRKRLVRSGSAILDCQAFCPTGGDARRYIYIVRRRIEGAFNNTTGAYRGEDGTRHAPY